MSAPAGALTETRPKGRSSKRRRFVLTVVGLIAIAAAAAGYTLMRPASNTTDTSTDRVRTTAQIERRDLVETETLSGVLEHADKRDVTAASQGVLTGAADEGSIVKRGERLFDLNGLPVRLLYGKVPAYRTMSYGVDDGADVRQLERNLTAMGYDPYEDMEVDREFDPATTAAIKRWEDDLGITDDGALSLGEIVFLDGPRRVAEASAQLGSQVGPGATVLSTTSLKKTVSVDLEVGDQDLVKEGQRVQVELPDGSTRKGTVAHIGTVATGGSEDDAAAGGETADDPATVEVTIELSRPVAGFDQASVDVSVMSSVTKDAVSVPVAALLALAEGGYAVEVVDAGGTRLVEVEPQDFADGWVQVDGDVREGQEVVVPE